MNVWLVDVCIVKKCWEGMCTGFMDGETIFADMGLT